MSTTLQEEIETETREMLIYICMVCECWGQELDSEIENVICGNCGNQDVRVSSSFMYDREIKEAA